MTSSSSRYKKEHNLLFASIYGSTSMPTRSKGSTPTVESSSASEESEDDASKNCSESSEDEYSHVVDDWTGISTSDSDDGFDDHNIDAHGDQEVDSDVNETEDDESQAYDITVLAAQKYLSANKAAKTTSTTKAEHEEDAESIFTVISADEVSVESWLRKPIGGLEGEAIPPSFIPPPKQLSSDSLPSSDSEEHGLDSRNRSSLKSSTHSKSTESDSEEEREREEEHEVAAPLPFAPKKRSKLSKSIHQFNEKLFGDKRPKKDKSDKSFETPPEVAPRELLQSEVFYNAATKLWVATIHTDQKSLDRGDNDTAIKTIQAHSFRSEDEAVEAVSSMAPPLMQPFGDNPTCYDCGGKFAVFRRACHCRNCGVCICKGGDCSVQWPCQSVPDTYNVKGEKSINICRSCHSLSSRFRDALLEGDVEACDELYETGNINLRSPFAHAKGETFYPVHCAVLSGNIEMLQWLVDDHCVPLKMGRHKLNNPRDGTVVTGKGRSVLDLAILDSNVNIMRYLVCEKNISVLNYKDIARALLALDATLRALNDAVAVDSGNQNTIRSNAPIVGTPDECRIAITRANRRVVDGDQESGENDENQSSSSISEINECIICCNNTINTCFVPCGHQICCLGCSKGLRICPMCSAEGNFIKTFRP